MKERLIKFLAYLDMGQNKFETIVGLSIGYVNKVGDSIRESSLAKISKAYPELNINWLKTGEGNMLNPFTISQRGNMDSTVVGQMHGGTINHNGGKDRLIDEQKEEVDKMFEAIIIAVNGFQKASERHDDYIVRQDDYIKRQDEYIASIIHNSYVRNERNMDRIDKVIDQQNQIIEKQGELMKIVMLQNERTQDRADKLIELISTKF